MHDEVLEGLRDRVAQAEPLEPHGRGRAGRGRALADLVAIEHQHARAGPLELARERQSGEARAADRARPSRRAAAFDRCRGLSRGSASPPMIGGGGRPVGGAALRFRAVSTVLENPTAKIVDGSDGLLLEIDGEIVPNYDATMHPFQEGEVVTGHVVRIDHDEVLVDIGYKSEGVIPANELSIRKSVDPHDEVTLGEEVDALVLTKEDQDGRLIMSKKRARFEKAWRRIEAAAESGEPVEGTVIEVVKGGLIIDLGRARLPARLAGRHPPRAEPRRVHGHADRVQGDRAQPLAQQRRALAPRRARGGAQGGPPADPRPAAARAWSSRARSRTSSTSARSSTSTASTA